MERDIILKYNKELRTSAPILYEGIQLYPVRYKHYDEFKSLIGCLLINPIYSDDSTINSLPRLYFLTNCLCCNRKQDTSTPQFQAQKARILQIFGLLKLVFREDQSFDFTETKSGRMALRVWNNNCPEKSVVINAKKFEPMREIILVQNNVAYDDTYIHPDILRYIETTKQKESSTKKSTVFETMEDKVEALMLKFNQPNDDFLNEMTIRRVERLVAKIIDEGIYNAQMYGSMSGMVKFKESPTHWMSTKLHQSDFDKYLKELK